MKGPSVTVLKKYLTAMSKNKVKYMTCERLSRIVGVYPEVIVIYYKIIFDYSWNEIVKEAGIPLSTARLIYKKAKEKLKKELRK